MTLSKFTITPLIIMLICCSCKKDKLAPVEELTLSKLSTSLLPNIELNSATSGNNLEYSKNLLAFLSKSIDNKTKITINNKDRNFKCRVKALTLTSNEVTNDVAYNLNNTNDTITVNVKNKLDPNSSYSIRIDFEYLEEINNAWEIIKINNTPTTSTLTKDFTTAKLPSEIISLLTNNINIIKDAFLTNNTWPNVMFNYSTTDTIRVTKNNASVNIIRPRLDEVSIKQNDETMNTKEIWNNSQDLLVYTESPFNSNSTINFQIKVTWEELIDGEWIDFVDINGDVMSEKKSLEYKIDDKIPEGYIAAIYPLPRQFNLYPLEYTKGYLELDYNASLIKQIENLETLQVKFTLLPENNVLTIIDAKYQNSDNTIWFDLPSNLQHGKIYQIEYISNSKTFYSSEFRVSDYDLVSQKIPTEMDVSYLANHEVEFSELPCDYLGCIFYPESNTYEGFDLYEISGYKNEPIIKITALLDQWDWYNDSYYSYIYNNYSKVKGFSFSNELISQGIPPKNYFSIAQHNGVITLSDNEIETGDVKYKTENTHFINKLPDLWAQAYTEIHNVLKKEYSNSDLISSDSLKHIYDHSSFPPPLNGNYSIRLDYILPGKHIKTSSFEIKITNNLYP